MEWKSRIVGHDRVPAGQLLANPFNHRLHPPVQREVVAASIAELGVVKSVIVNRVTGHIVDGHERVMQALGFGEGTLVDVEIVELSPEEEKKALLLLDASSELAEVDRGQLVELVEGWEFSYDALRDLASSMLAEAGVGAPESVPLAERFGAIPFSVLSASDEWWVARREAWVRLGPVGGVDPVLVELLLRWFCVPGGLVLDPLGSLGPSVVSGVGRVPVAFPTASRCDFVFASLGPGASLGRLAEGLGSLAEDRFAAVLVSGSRAGEGGTVDRVGEVVQIFAEAGLAYYNEAMVLLGGPVDVSGFGSERRLGVSHAVLLVFVRGCPKAATAAIGEIEFGDVSEAQESL